MRNRHELTKNYIFRFYQCGLSIEDTAKLCFKTVRTVTLWDKGKPIPPECKRLMRMYAGIELDPLGDEWREWSLKKGRLITPNNWSLTPERIITGNALLEINAEDDRKLKAEIIRVARLLKKLP
ncbi:regulator [Photobacterium sp. J15]|uniref:regulator n=1 Tax=Photobacterium sp. J15 TaxID=265901 RepID=UPI0007E45F5E|nr:regulator [Photobacterium sp. J15]